jgi:uncharacterized membrane protein
MQLQLSKPLSPQKKLSRLFIEALITFLPAFLTFFIVFSILKALHDLLDFGVFLLPEHFRSNILLTIPIAIVTGVLISLLIALVGKGVQTFFGKIFIDRINLFIASIPIIKIVFTSLQKFFKVIFGSAGKTFSRPVLVSFPYPGKKSIGFLTGEAEFKNSDGSKATMYKVFVPTVPNPTSGFLIHYPKELVDFPQISTEEALQLILSAGILSK